MSRYAHFCLRRPLEILLIVCLTVISSAAQHAYRLIEVDASQIVGPVNRNFQFCVGAGRANEGLRADWQRQLRMVKKECGFKYIRFHGLLSDDMGVYFEDRQGNPVYNWQYVDELFDFLLSIDIKPFVEFGFMPNALASGKKTVFWWRGNITTPKDYAKWNALISNLVQHWIERYGKEEVLSWYFEVWNEPNLKDLFFSGDQRGYFRMYSETAKAVKSVCEKFRVGGPATAGNGWIEETLNFCNSTQTPIDFVSTHTYGVNRGFLDQTGDVGTIVSQNPRAIYGDMIRVRRQVQNSFKPDLELHYTEWSSSYTPTDPIHDSYHEAAYILDKVSHAAPYVTSMSYWTFTDIFEELGPRCAPFHGGFGLLNYQDIKKPAFYAYQFLNKLGSLRLQCPDSATIAAKNNNNDLQLLFWDFSVAYPGDSTNDQTYFKRDLPPTTLGFVTVNAKGLASGMYQMELFQVGHGVNDAYATYMDLGSPSQLTKAQVSEIQDRSAGTSIQSKEIQIGRNGIFETSVSMRQNDVYLLSLKKK